MILLSWSEAYRLQPVVCNGQERLSPPSTLSVGSWTSWHAVLFLSSSETSIDGHDWRPGTRQGGLVFWCGTAFPLSVQDLYQLLDLGTGRYFPLGPIALAIRWDGWPPTEACSELCLLGSSAYISPSHFLSSAVLLGIVAPRSLLFFAFGIQFSLLKTDVL